MKRLSADELLVICGKNAFISFLHSNFALMYLESPLVTLMVKKGRKMWNIYSAGEDKICAQILLIFCSFSLFLFCSLLITFYYYYNYLYFATTITICVHVHHQPIK